MHTAHAVFDKAINWAQDLSQREHHAFVKSRLAAVPVLGAEVATLVAQGALVAPVELVRFITGIGAKVISVISGSEAVRKFADAQPDLTKFLKTVCKVIGYAIGVALTTTLGTVAPEWNLRLHCKLGLATDQRAVLAAAAKKDEDQEAEQMAKVIEEARREAAKLARENEPEIVLVREVSINSEVVVTQAASTVTAEEVPVIGVITEDEPAEIATPTQGDFKAVEDSAEDNHPCDEVDHNEEDVLSTADGQDGAISDTDELPVAVSESAAKEGIWSRFSYPSRLPTRQDISHAASSILNTTRNGIAGSYNWTVNTRPVTFVCQVSHLALSNLSWGLNKITFGRLGSSQAV